MPTYRYKLFNEGKYVRTFESYGSALYHAQIHFMEDYEIETFDADPWK